MKPQRILIVEDEMVVALDLEQRLAAMGYPQVSQVKTGRAAVEVARQENPSLILMDIHMPGDLDGIQAALEIRQQQDIPVIFMTAYGDDDTVRRARIADPYGYLIKPINDQELQAAIDMSLSKHQMEQRLRWSEEQFRTVVEAAPDAIFIQVREQFAYLNPMAARLFGGPEESGLLEKPVADYFHASCREAVGELIREVASGKRSRPPLEGKIVRRDGLDLEVEISAVPFTHRQHPGALVFARDISQRKRGEAVMEVRLRLLELADTKTMEELLRATLDEAEALTRSQVGFYHFLEADQSTVTRQAWSTNTARVLSLAGGSGGRHPVDPAGAWQECVKERRPVVRNDFASLPNPGQSSPGGVRLTRELAVPVIRGGKVAAVLGLGNKPAGYVQVDIEAVMALADLAWDIASRKRAEEAHRASEERFRDFTFTLADCAWEVDAGGRFTYVSDSVGRVLGREVHEFLGRTPFEFMPPAEARRVGQIFDELVARKAPFTDLENSMYHRDGTTRSLLTTAVPVLDPHGNLLGYRGTDKDITERKRLESQLREAQKLEAVGQLAGGVAHDFNNLLSATMMHLSLLQENHSLDEDTRQALKELEMESKRASNLTRQLLMFSRRSVLEIQVMDLNKVVANLVKMLGRLIGENISLKFLPCPEIAAVEGDVGMMEQVLMNLVVNARDAMPRGGRLMISTSLVDLGPESSPAHPGRRPGRFVRLSVTDTGCGMDEATLKRIFEPFFTTKEAGVGTGLGLAIVHGIVAQHQGWVEVESQVGAGTAFRVFFNTSASAVAGAVEAPKPKASRGHETILLVEDDDIVREIAQRCLEAFGYRVLSAANGREAMVSWQKHRQDIALLFTDMVLPEGMTGLELAEKLRAENPALKVIVCSGYSSEKLKRGIAAATGVVYLAKPFQAEVLIQIVRESLDRNS